MELRLADVQVRHDGPPVLEGVDLTVSPGSKVAVLGPPSSGKTTLLKTLAGLLRPSRGQVLWDGEDPWARGEDFRRERQAAFGMVFQTDALFDSQTVLQNVMVPLLRRGADAQEARARAEAVLGEVGLLDAADLLPEALSGGMAKRAGIARALAGRPQVLLADDPLAGLDPSTAHHVARLLLASSERRTLIVALPDPSPHLPLDRRLFVEAGRVRST